MDPTKVIYAAAASSNLDSWDFENLHYIRKISRTCPAETQDLEPVSYISEENEDEETLSLPCLQLEKENTRAHNTVARPAPQATVGGNQVENRAERVEKVREGMLALDDCYLLDVVTVRNESVMALSPHPYDHPGQNKEDLQHSPPSPSLSNSSSPPPVPFQGFFLSSFPPETFPLSPHLQQEKDFFDLSVDTRSLHSEASLVPTVFRRHAGCLLDVASVSGPNRNLGGVDADPGRGRGDECRFCHQNPEFYENKQEKRHLEDVSMQVAVGEEAPSLLPRSPSPYYVRLRRDLLAAIITPPRRMKISRPRNFTVNTQGQLAIDYSSNWLGLENYVRNKKR